MTFQKYFDIVVHMANNTNKEVKPDIKSIDYNKGEIIMTIPVTVTGGKFRFYDEDGNNIKPCKEGFTASGDFCEWQIGHDAIAKDEKAKRSTLRDCSFRASNKKNKVLYELAEFVYYFRQFGFITNDDLTNMLTEFENIPTECFISESPEFAICYGDEKDVSISDIDGYCKERIHKDWMCPLDFGWWIDIKVDKRQKATGVQPMLYLCIPVKELNKTLIGRKAETNEVIDFVINEKMVNNFMRCMKLLGYLSPNNNFDARQIIKSILNN